MDNQCHVFMCINLCAENHLRAPKASFCSLSRMQHGRVDGKPNLKIEGRGLFCCTCLVAVDERSNLNDQLVLLLLVGTFNLVLF